MKFQLLNVMEFFKLKYHALFVFILVFNGLQAQEAISVTGGDASGSGGSVSYSVGQVFYQTKTGSKGEMYEGVQQPYTISVVQTTTKAKEINLSILVYPNPATDILNLVVDNYTGGNMVYSVSDIQGKMLQKVRITGSKTSINMRQFSPSTYIVNLMKDNHLIKSFKIIKR